MLREEFKQWLLSTRKVSKKAAENRVSNAAKVNRVYDLDKEYASDRCESLLAKLELSRDDYENGIIPQCGITIDGNYYTGFQTLRQAVRRYVEFLNSTASSQALVLNTVSQSKQSTGSSKAIFEGTFDEFIKFVGGYTKNKIATITKAFKKTLNNVCEACGKPVKQLDAAHINGAGRQTIIKDLLDKTYKDPNDANRYIVDLEQFEEDYKNAHLPIKKHFFFLCRACHDDYDYNPQKLTDAEILNAIAKRNP